MRICKYIIAAIVTAALAPAPALRAQESSVNTFSPYTMYGLGNLNASPSSAFVGMGGASIGFRNGGFDTNGDLRVNLSNPASLSAIPARSMIFEVGMGGSNVYLRQRTAAETLNTSFNTFNFNNVSIALPLANKLGLAFNVSPFSEVGYRVHTDDVSYLADLGVVRYYYNGEGDVSEAKLAVGWEPFKNLSVGAEVNYLWGNINRTYQAVIQSYTGSGQYGEVSTSQGGSGASTNEKVARMFGAFGVQYTAISKEKTRLTLGATYRMGGKLNSTVTDFIPSNNIYGDTIRFSQMTSAMKMPQRIGVGVSLVKPKWAIGADYLYENWGDSNGYDAVNDVRYVNTNTFKLGGQYTPDRYDIRGRFGSFFNRMTYKAGARVGGNYLELQGRSIDERAVTMGVDIPFRATNVSKLSLGVELMERGSLRDAMVRERYFKINVGVMLFGRDYDYWFEKYKYN
ncbi:MAG: hypothetical protein LBV38_01475 [Alistipes sp.]|jgi:hypothetical protein|nr:hypothetical protein [Alistipes sp.]